MGDRLLRNQRVMLAAVSRCRITKRLLFIQATILLFLAVLIVNGCTTTNSTNASRGGSYSAGAGGNLSSGDRFSDASYISEHSEITGYVSRGSSRVYRLELNRPAKLSIDMSIAESRQDLDLILYDSSKRQLYSSMKIAGNNENITANMPEGTYFIEVKSYQSSASSFTLSVLRKIEEPLTLRLTNIMSSVPLSETGKVSGVVGTLSKTRDVWYKLNLRQRSKLNIVLKIERSGQDLDMTLTDGKGIILYSSTGSFNTEQMNVELEPGQYHIRVFVYDDRFGSEFNLESTATALALPKESKKAKKKHMEHKYKKKQPTPKQSPESHDSDPRVQRGNPEPRIQRLDQEPRIIKLN